MKSIGFSYFMICLFLTVDLVSHDRMTDRSEVDSDLMRATCEEIDLEEGIFISNNSLVAKFCFSNFRIDWIDGGHFFAIIGVSSDE